MNTRRFSRTTSEAFKGLDYSCSLERPAPRFVDKLVIWMCFFGLLAVIAVVI